MRQLTAVALALVSTSAAAGQGPLLRAEPVASGLASPVFLAAAPGDTARAFVIEYLGRVRILNLTTNTVLPTPFVDLSTQVDPAGGLLGMAIDPQFATTRHIYFYWIALNGGDSVITRYTASAANPNVADPASAHTVWRFARPFGHHGGWLAFGPDGNLWLASGDGGHFNNITEHAQDLNNLYGKLLRIDPYADDYPADPDRNYAIPTTNPQLGPNTRPEIWAYGLRNAFRASFDRQTRELWIGDVGHNDREELDIEPPPPPFTSLPGGRNYGWPCREGTLCTGYMTCTCPSPSLAEPMFEYPRTTGRCITGGYVYRGQAIAGLRGTYIFADFQDNKVFTLYPTRAPAGWINGVAGFRERTAEVGNGAIAQPVSLGEDAAGEVYILSFSGGTVHRVAAVSGAAGCYANCDGSSGSPGPAVNVADFTCFLQRFASGDPYANCDDSTTPPTLNVGDFTCFLQRFAQCQ
jgi:glucose/arabinose dehydrogenase